MTVVGGNVYLSFQGVGFTTSYRQSFDVLVGDNPPVITGGYANWTPLKRPLQRALTIFTGYDPVQMAVEVRFGRWANGWQTDDMHGQQVEADIGKLEWMAGSNFQQGPSPAVYVWSHSSQGGDTDLVPPQYANVPWVITALEWGKAWRNTNGYRVWQEATITLQHYQNLTAAPPPNTNKSGGYFTTTAARNTALLIAGAPSSLSPMVDHRILAGRILSDAKNNPCKSTSIKLSGKSLSYPIRVGVSVWVPSHQTA